MIEGDQPADALPVLADLLAIGDRIDGSRDLMTYARHNRAEANLLLGRLDEAEQDFRAVLVEYEGRQESGVDSSGVQFGLAKIAAQRGHHAEAVEGFTQALATVRELVGEDGPWTLKTRFELANLARRNGNSAEARAEHDAVLAARTRVLGPDHPDTAASRTAVAGFGG
ncbi:MAG TPA: tetratricopeptide repeat protein [Amycolatopsis sp.]|nr:tetratricopeptide repeat protein [Amycolatopsis sp.]